MLTSKILIVDDEPAVVSGLQALLELHDLHADGACDRDDAELRVASQFYPIILTDLRMRAADDGLRLLESVRRISPASCVAVMTGYADAATEARLRALGSQLVLRKPFEEEELMRAVREMLATIERSTAAADVETAYVETKKTLLGIARRRYGFAADEAEDLAQEAWLLYLAKQQQIRTPKAWLTGTVANLCRQEIDRRTRAREKMEGQVPLDRVEPSYEDGLALRSALARLDERSRQLCTWIGLEERSYDEVSAAAGIPLGSVGPLYIRAKAKLKNALALRG